MIKHYTVETFAVFNNVDRSILATNKFIEKFGYEFICINLEELEKNFSDLLSLPKNFHSAEQILLGDSGITISGEFYRSLTNSSEFGFSALMAKEVILLKAVNDFEQEIIDNTKTTYIGSDHLGKIQNFVTALIQQFRLFKNGGIRCPIYFQIHKNERLITSKLGGGIGKPVGHTTYFITEQEADVLGKSFKNNFSSTALTELAINNFNVSYDISDLKTRYITFMTCLESLFNQGRDQITHIVSRHLALIISKDEKEFKENYYRIKKLYKIRSDIVHGGVTKEDLPTVVNEIQNKVRQAINYCLNLSLDKQQLFDKLNSWGFNSSPS